MKKEIIKPTSIEPISKSIPSSIDSKILELLQKPADKTKFESDGNSIRVQKVIGNDIMNIEIKQYSDGKSITQSTFSSQGPKANLEKTVKQMSSEGIKNKEIADLLDIDPSYVSKLKNR